MFSMKKTAECGFVVLCLLLIILNDNMKSVSSSKISMAGRRTYDAFFALCCVQYCKRMGWKCLRHNTQKIWGCRCLSYEGVATRVIRVITLD